MPFFIRPLSSISLVDGMASQSVSPLLAFVAFALLFARAFGTTSSCYTGDGDLDTSSQPCPGSNMCCYLNRNDGYADDVCIQGACYSNYWTGQYFVIGCTYQDWDEPGSSCSPLWDACGRQSGYTHVSRCGDGSFCCGEGNTTCCSDYSGIYLNVYGTKILQPDSAEIEDTTTSSSYAPHSSPIPTSLETRISTPTRTPTASQSPQIATATTAPTSDTPKEGLKTAEKVGIGISVSALVVAVLGVWKQYRKR
ncbi:hypothetical protein BKA58DRAFT_53993 [Alternaria rosae]|uniref:uncharacterized protein n=1 Tax=Alternaria rosae TaxID=1187941 RepID=UPI001E8D2352|nr:uncharacterized protein BKA58DRAFT_53993 [Alternaria rosae]KAH6859111.1 hypothetical protein BKA58DRAFT_53993 [Alternaria rosae]